MIQRLFALLLAVAVAAPACAQPLRVMSFNVRLPIEADGLNRWAARRDLAAAVIARERPDVIGTQELHKRQGDDLIGRLPGYAWFGIDRRGGHADEHMGVVYNRRTLRLIGFGQFWLSDTPHVPGSISWGHPYPRMVTWAIFERSADKRRFRLLNTHLPYRAEDDAARIKGATMIVRSLRNLPGDDLPTVLTGDFNTTPDSAAYRILTARLADTRNAAPRRGGPAETFHAYTGTADRRIDWILTSGFTPLAARTLTDHAGPVWASDHFPIVAELAFTR
jgi:endonuclease/exonuclease/phosphatase family metal-dependent hydrolase